MSDSKPKLTQAISITLASIILTIAVILMVVCGALVQGFVLSKMWEWFLIPLGCNPLNWINAVGLALMIRWLTWQPRDKKKEDDTNKNEEALQKLGGAFIYPFVILGLGWIAHCFM